MTEVSIPDPNDVIESDLPPISEEYQNSGRTSDTNGHWHAFTEESDRTGPPQPAEEGDDHTHVVTQGADGKVVFAEEDGHTHDSSVDILSAHPDGTPDDADIKKKKKKKYEDDADAGSDALDELKLALLTSRLEHLQARAKSYHGSGNQKPHGRRKNEVGPFLDGNKTGGTIELRPGKAGMLNFPTATLLKGLGGDTIDIISELKGHFREQQGKGLQGAELKAAYRRTIFNDKKLMGSMKRHARTLMPALDGMSISTKPWLPTLITDLLPSNRRAAKLDAKFAEKSKSKSDMVAKKEVMLKKIAALFDEFKKGAGREPTLKDLSSKDSHKDYHAKHDQKTHGRGKSVSGSKSANAVGPFLDRSQKGGADKLIQVLDKKVFKRKSKARQIAASIAEYKGAFGVFPSAKEVARHRVGRNILPIAGTIVGFGSITGAIAGNIGGQAANVVIRNLEQELDELDKEYHAKHDQKTHGRGKSASGRKGQQSSDSSGVGFFLKRPGGVSVFDVTRAEKLNTPEGWQFNKNESAVNNVGIWNFRKSNDNNVKIVFDPRGNNNLFASATVRGGNTEILGGASTTPATASSAVLRLMAETKNLDFGRVGGIRKAARQKIPGLNISAKEILNPATLALLGGAVGGITGAVTTGGLGTLQSGSIGSSIGSAIGRGIQQIGLSDEEIAHEYENLNKITGVEIFRTGKWNNDIYNTNDLDDMVSAFGRENTGFVPPVKVGHSKESGARAFGWVESIRRDGDRLVADFVDVPDKVYQLIKDRGLDTVSAEIFWNLKRGGKEFRRALKAVALLGAEIPAVSGLAPLRTVVNSQEEESFERVASYELKLIEVESMDKIDELAAQISDLEAKLTEAEDAAVEIEAAVVEDEASEEFAEQLEAAITARDQAEDELKTAKAELDKAYKAKDVEIVELTKQVKKLQAAQEYATEEKRVEVVSRKAELCKVPALRPHIESLYDVATKSERQVNFTQGDDTAEFSAEQIVDKLVETLNSDATKLFREISTVDTANRTASYEDPGAEVNKRVGEYQTKNADKTYEESFSAILASDPELAKAYAAS